MRRSVKMMVAALLMTVFVGGSVVQAGEHPDFTGKWVIDLGAKESTTMSPLLETQGASWMERKAADNLSVNQNITQTDKTLTINVDGGVMTKTEVLKLDGSTETRQTDRLGPVENSSRWDSDGKTIVTEIKYKTPDGKDAVWTTRRYLVDDGKRIMVDHLIKLEDGSTIKATRVLVKQQ